MKILKVILIILVVVIGGFVIWMALTDGKFDVKRNVMIDATPELVYAEVSDLSTWPEWGVWFEKDSTMTSKFYEQTQGQGAYYTWEGKDGKGRLEIVEADPGKSMKTKIDFEGMGSSNGYWTFEPMEGGTMLTWGMSGEMPFFFRFMAAGMDKYVGPDFETGLNNLKELLESRKPAYEFEETTLSSATIYYMHFENEPMATMSSDWYSKNWAMLSSYLGEDMQNMTGAPMTVYWDWNEEAETFSADLAMPCASEKPGNDMVMKGESYGGKAMKTTYMGPYSGTGEAHMALEEYMKANNIPFGGPAMEVYVTNPQQEPDTTKWITEIYYGIAEEEPSEL
jgi:effector-binding domain-containing protein/uncharacterized protein YndB with AHSA1/START domain